MSQTKVRLYNLIAKMCSFIISHCTQDFFVKFSCITQNEKDRIKKIVSVFIPISVLSEQNLTEDYFSALENLFKILTVEEDYFCIVRLIQLLDRSLKKLLEDDIKQFQQEDFSFAINTNREEVGIGLFPRCVCYWERKHRLSHCYDRLDNFLSNILLIENSVLGQFIDVHTFLKADMFENFGISKTLKIAASPLRNDSHFLLNIHDDDRIQYFSVQYQNSYFQQDNELIWNKILTAAKENAHIIVFPEMLGNPLTESFICQKIKELPKKHKKTLPSLIVLPSLWQDRKNCATIIDKKGNVICRQCKQFPFRYEKNGTGLLEGIKADFIINILHYEGIGRIAILICKDFLTTQYMEHIMRCFKLTLIIVPSYSTGSYDFKQSFDLCAHDDCNVVWINTCAAMTEGKEANFESIGYVRKRVSKFDDESQKLYKMKICSSAFDKICNKDCIYFESINGI